MTGIPFKGWFTAKTAKAKKCKRIDEDDFDEVAAVHVQTGWKEASVFGEKLKKGSNYLVKKDRDTRMYSLLGNERWQANQGKKIRTGNLV